MQKKMELDRALEVFEYNKAMLTCDMSITRDPEHQDVSPDYYGKDAEDLYYAIVCVEEYIKNAIPIEWIVNKWAKKFWKVINGKKYYTGDGYDTVWDMIEDWEKENGK